MSVLVRAFMTFGLPLWFRRLSAVSELWLLPAR